MLSALVMPPGMMASMGSRLGNPFRKPRPLRAVGRQIENFWRKLRTENGYFVGPGHNLIADFTSQPTPLVGSESAEAQTCD